MRINERIKNVPLLFLMFLPRPSARFPVNDFVGCVAHTCTVAYGKYGVPHTRTWVAKVGLCLQAIPGVASSITTQSYTTLCTYVSLRPRDGVMD